MTILVKLTKKKNPKALFIPTASSDSENYIKKFNKIQIIANNNIN